MSDTVIISLAPVASSSRSVLPHSGHGKSVAILYLLIGEANFPTASVVVPVFLNSFQHN